MRLHNINKVLITGLPRTGTTFFGNFLGSAQDVDSFQLMPPMMPIRCLIVLIAFLGRNGTQLLESYRFEELLSQSIAGRRLNFNPCDDSFVYKFKSNDRDRGAMGRVHAAQVTWKGLLVIIRLPLRYLGSRKRSPSYKSDTPSGKWLSFLESTKMC